jgi:pyruvate dehydrogenase E2 component (dihydrolipoamide acetyltransferase)
MSVRFLMPALGADMTEGTVVEWRVHPGDTVKRGDVVALVETAKGIIDVEVFHDGTVEKLLVEPGTEVPVGTALAVFSGEEAAASPAGAPAAAPPEPAPDTTATSRTGPTSVPARPTSRARISPAARRRAEAAGLSVETLAGTGADGVITLDDVERAIAGPRAAMRHAIAAAMARAKREIPHYYLAQQVDFGPAVEWLQRFNADRPVEERLLHAVLLIKALARAASEIPGFAGFFRNGRFQPAGDIHVGFAIAQRGGGLVAPGLLKASTKDLPALMRELKDLVARTRGGHLRSSELELPVITLTSLGDEGVEAVFPIIFPDQVAIVGAGRVEERPWVVDGKVIPRPVLTLTLAADHRVTDGRTGGRFLARIAALLSRPGEL